MSNLFRILLFVPPMFLFNLPAFSQLSGTIEQNPANGTFTVSVIPSVTWVPPQSVTSSATLTFRAPTGKFQLASLQSHTGNWINTGVFVAPAEAPTFDYFTFALQTALPTVTYTNGVKLSLFSFNNSLGCAPVELIDNNTDPLNIEPNSISVGVSNYFSVIGGGSGNAYSGNTVGADFVGCPALSLSVTAGNNPVLCHGDVTTMALAISGGVAPYEIIWENLSNGQSNNVQVTSFEGSATLTSMPAGDYVFTVVDNLDSTSAINLMVQQPSNALNINMLGLAVPCEGNYDGEVQVESATGGTGSYHYQWEGFPTETDSIVSAITAGTYHVTVSDDNGCTVSGSATVEAAGYLIFSQTVVKDISCNGASNGLIDLYPISPSGGQLFDFQWSSNAAMGNTSSAWQLGPGSYSVTVTDLEFGCVGDAMFHIEEPLAIEVDYSLTEPRCYGDDGVLEIIGISNAIQPWEVTIAGGESENIGDMFILEPGLALKLQVKDAKGCQTSEDFIVPAKQPMQLEIGKSRDIKYGEEVRIDAAYFPFQDVTFSWTPADGLSCTDCPDPIATPTENVTYHLQMTDTAGCTIDDFINLAVVKSRDIFIPNSFSPNHDGINDSFYPYGGFEIIAVHSMQVYDRWGSKVFESTDDFMPNDEKAGWSGFAKDKLANAGTYLYTMNVEFIDGEIILFSGEVNLMK